MLWQLLANAACGLLSHLTHLSAEAHDFLNLLHAVLQGILLEASPSHFEGMAAARPAATCVHAAVCNASSVVHYADAGMQRAPHRLLCIRCATLSVGGLSCTLCCIDDDRGATPDHLVTAMESFGHDCRRLCAYQVQWAGSSSS